MSGLNENKKDAKKRKKKRVEKKRQERKKDGLKGFSFHSLLWLIGSI